MFFFLTILARYITVQPESSINLYDEVGHDSVYKFLFRGAMGTVVNIYFLEDDGEEKLIYTSKNTFDTIFLGCADEGVIRIEVFNNSPEKLEFAHKAPNLEHEGVKMVGYVDGENKLFNLRKMLNELISEQKHLDQVILNNRKRISQINKRIVAVIFAEGLALGIGIYMMHQKFISMFEQKKAI